MPLSVAGLLRTGMNTSKNVLLQNIVAQVDQYNLLLNASQVDRLDVLDRVMLCVVAYLTDKRPKKDSPSNVARWDALDKLAAQCYAEAKRLGGTLISTPTNLKNVDAGANCCYLLERLDPLHRSGMDLSLQYQYWLGDPDQRATSFWEYVGIAPGTFISQYQSKKKGGLAPAFVKMLTDQQLQKYEIRYLGQWLDAQNQPASTQFMNTVFSGYGWAIFVLSTTGRLYIHRHVKHRFHHSSFVQGGAIRCAGELVIDATGRIRVVTTKTGHFKVGEPELQAMLRQFPAPQIADDTVLCANPWQKGAILVQRAGDFRAKGMKAPPLSANSPEFVNLPMFAKSSSLWRAAGLTPAAAPKPATTHPAVAPVAPVRVPLTAQDRNAGYNA
jgi:hypothetical protein